MRIVIDLPPEQAVRVRKTLGGEEGARRLLLRLLGSVLDAAAPMVPSSYLLDTRPEIPAAMSLAGDPIRLHLHDQPADTYGYEQAESDDADPSGAQDGLSPGS
ncbi:hypothetical protein [Armatimonas sp.]|uniref:hypothetical protein n=1 Tax=Armatimonas sp. TaxID=1872638 RepID=UPI00286A2ED4|nr:hypothetical protein [Armatimonas sp.]